MDRPQAGQSILALDYPDPGRLAITSGGSHASGLKNHVQLGLRNRIAAERVARIATLKDTHKRVGSVVIFRDFLLNVRKRGAIHDLAKIAHAAEYAIFHFQ